MKEDRRVYMGRSGDVLVNRLGFATIREAALAGQLHPAATSSAILVHSIETVGQVAAAEKKRTVQPAARTPYMRPSGIFFFFFFFFIVTSPRIRHPAWQGPANRAASMYNEVT